MSRSCNNLALPPPSCSLPVCSIPCTVICCNPPVSYPCMPRASGVQCKTARRPQSAPKPIKTVVYLPPCPNCRMSCPPKIEMTYLPPSPSPPPPPPCFYVCTPNCVPCIPCSSPTASRGSPCRPPLPCPPY